MKDNKDRPGRISTCFEESTCAEMMQDIMSEHGIGSLCEEMMRSLAAGRRKGKADAGESRTEQGRGKESSNKNGGVK